MGVGGGGGGRRGETEKYASLDQGLKIKSVCFVWKVIVVPKRSEGTTTGPEGHL